MERLLADTADGADALPLLALAMERLYRDFGDDGDLTVAEYESMGGMSQIVQTEVDKLLAADPEQRQAQLDTLHDAFIPWLATNTAGCPDWADQWSAQWCRGRPSVAPPLTACPTPARGGRGRHF